MVALFSTAHCNLHFANKTLQIIRIQGTKSDTCYNSMVIKETTTSEFHIAKIVNYEIRTGKL